nr:MerR family transcriptional regulator [Antrihabitans stalagmiti]
MAAVGWSTRQLADLAGTTLRTVRHYHEVGLLPEPERAPNGYKSYGVAHLVRLLRIRRLVDLGFSLPRIADLGAADEHPDQALRALDAELAATIERLQRARVEVAQLLGASAPTDLPPELAMATAGADLTDADRTFVVVMSRVLSPAALDAYTRMLQAPEVVPAGRELDNLPADADERTRRELAARLLPQIRDLYTEYPDLLDAGAVANASTAAHAVDVAITDLYNSAQRDVMRRVAQELRDGALS